MTEFEKLILEKLDGIQNDMSGMKKDMSGMKNDMSGMQNDISNMQDDISGMKKDMSGMKNDMSGMQNDISNMQNDISSLKRTAIKTETELIPKTQLMLDNYISIAEKVNISNDLYEEVKTLRYEVDLIKQVLQTK